MGETEVVVEEEEQVVGKVSSTVDTAIWQTFKKGGVRSWWPRRVTGLKSS